MTLPAGHAWRTPGGQKKQKRPPFGSLRCLAEGVGFEPTDGLPSPVFKTGAFGHSATPPVTRA